MERQSRILSIIAVFLFAATMLSIILLSGHTKTTVLDITELETRLPYSLEEFSPVYDGKDYIYIVGGHFPNRQLPKTVLRFDVHSETIEELPHQIPHVLLSGPAVYNKEDGVIYYFGYAYNDFGVVKITLANTSEEFVASTNDTLLRFATGVWDPVGKKAYFLGKVMGGIKSRSNKTKAFWRFDPYAGDPKDRLTVLPFPFEAFHVCMIYSRREGLIYLLGGMRRGTGLKYSDAIAQFNPATGSVTLTEYSLPRGTKSAACGWDERRGEVYTLEDEGLMTFTPSTGETYFEELPKNLSSSILGSGVAYVASLKILYVFGGFRSDKITRIQL